MSLKAPAIERGGQLARRVWWRGLFHKNRSGRELLLTAPACRQAGVGPGQWNAPRSPGFTLLEIMMVVLIIGLLASIAVPSFVKARSDAKTSICVNNLRIIQSAKEQFALETNLSETTEPTAAEIAPYMKAAQLSGGLPVEPLGGSYSINAIEDAPTCDQPGHAL